MSHGARIWVMAHVHESWYASHGTRTYDKYSHPVCLNMCKHTCMLSLAFCFPVFLFFVYTHLYAYTHALVICIHMCSLWLSVFLLRAHTHTYIHIYTHTHNHQHVSSLADMYAMVQVYESWYTYMSHDIRIWVMAHVYESWHICTHTHTITNISPLLHTSISTN